MKTRTGTLVVTLVLLSLSLPIPWLATAATVTVTDCGDTGGPGQLRTLINNNNAGAGGDTINVPACTITLTTPASPLTITKNLTITGAGASQTIIDGGGITGIIHISAGTVAISDVTLRNGNGTGNFDDGGALYNAGTLTLTNTAISGNTADSEGGGIFNDATLRLVNSTVSGNRTPAGCCGGLETGSGGLTLVNSTVSGNTAAFSGAGGIGIFGPATLVNSTVSGNSALAGPGGGVRVGVAGTVTLKNTVIAGNTAASGNNCSITGALISNGHNLESATTCGFNTALGDLINTNPLLGPLQLNGGPTPTQALLPGSPAIDGGDNAGCPATDQRGVPRPLDATSPGFTVCDIGAFEVETLAFIHTSLSLNTATVRPGTLLQATVTVSNDGGARPLDVYVVFVLPAAAGPGLGCPSGDALALLTGAGATLTCGSSGVQTFAPFLTNVSLPTDLFTPVSAPLFSLGWPAIAPPGFYTAAFVLTPAGAFTDGRVNPTGEMVFATAGFSATP